MRLFMALGVAAAAALVGCGGGGDDGEPLISGSVTGSYDGNSFTAVNGFATLYQGSPLLAFGDGPIHCGSENSSSPPGGIAAIFAVPSLDPGSYDQVDTQFERVAGGSFDAVITSDGTVTIDSSDDTSVAGSVAYDYTDSDSKHYTVSGDFEVVHCAP